MYYVSLRCICIYIGAIYQNMSRNTCTNFTVLCIGENGVSESTGLHLSYLHSPIHRVVPGGWVQDGDIIDGAGSGEESLYGPTFDGRYLLAHYLPCSLHHYVHVHYTHANTCIEGCEVLNTLIKLFSCKQPQEKCCMISDYSVYQPYRMVSPQ